MTLQWPAPNRTAGFLDVLGLMGACGLLVARFVPLAKLPFWGCTLKARTGWPCPGCGLTRVAQGVAEGNLPAAWEANPLGTVVACAFVLLALVTLLHLVFAVPVPSLRVSPKEATGLRWAVVISALANYAWVVVKVR